MIKTVKRSADQQIEESSLPKKLKKSIKEKSNLEKKHAIPKDVKKKHVIPKDVKKNHTIPKDAKKNHTTPKDVKKKLKTQKDQHNVKVQSKVKNKQWKNFKSGKKFSKTKGKNTEKPADWKEYKKKIKEVRIKRKENKNLYEVINKAKKIAEKLRIKKLKGGQIERQKMCTELHELLGNQGIYPKLILTHDMARVIQYLIKFSSMEIRKNIADEMVSAMIDLLRSKYAKFCITRLLKYGDSEIRSNVINACYGNAVKLASHAVSASVFNYAFSTWATPIQKQHLIQEFFGDIYKQSKDNSIKHLRDVYENATDMKTATLGATKGNLQRILNKELLDSHLVQTVLMQFLQECTNDDRVEMIGLLNSHLAILSNSKEGSRAAMICIWQGTKKDRKISMKSLKEHVADLCKHEYGHCAIITLLDSVDDTVLLNKIILQEIVKNASDLIENEWGRKILAWLVAPGDTTHFHPLFLNELKEGKEKSESKKDTNVRREEILNYVKIALLKQVSSEFNKWFSETARAMVTLAILKTGSGEELRTVLDLLAKFIINPEWKVKEKESEISGIEHAGYHMILKKLIKHDETLKETDTPKFGAALAEVLDTTIVEKWIQSNRPCFVLLTIIETNSEKVQNTLTKMLKKCLKTLKVQKTPGARLLLKKIN